MGKGGGEGRGGGEGFRPLLIPVLGRDRDGEGFSNPLSTINPDTLSIQISNEGPSAARNDFPKLLQV